MSSGRKKRKITSEQINIVAKEQKLSHSDGDKNSFSSTAATATHFLTKIGRTTGSTTAAAAARNATASGSSVDAQQSKQKKKRPLQVPAPDVKQLSAKYGYRASKVGIFSMLML